MRDKLLKRSFDIGLAVVAIIILAIPLAVIAIWIKYDSRGPILFRQKRVGKDNKLFTVYKFRSMTTDAPSSCPTNSFKNAGAYITRSGRIMRKLSIDELPQIFNVLTGDMSIVGPRPVVPNETRLLSERKKYNTSSVKPGITGWAQVNGRDELNDETKARLDGEYIKQFGFRMDMKCLWMTTWAVLSISGYREGHEANTRPTMVHHEVS